MNIALKEAGETLYWFEILHDAEIINDTEFNSVYKDERKRILSSIVKSGK